MPMLKAAFAGPVRARAARAAFVIEGIIAEFAEIRSSERRKVRELKRSLWKTGAVAVGEAAGALDQGELRSCPTIQVAGLYGDDR